MKRIKGTFIKRLKIVVLLVALAGLTYPTKAKAEPMVLLAQEPIVVTVVEAPIAEPVTMPVMPVSKPVKSVAIKPLDQYACNCYLYAAAKTGKNIRGYKLAKNVPVNSQTASIGSIVVFTPGPAGHLAIVIGIDGDYLVLDEANYKPCKVTQGRRVPLASSSIKGYIK